MSRPDRAGPFVGAGGVASNLTPGTKAPGRRRAAVAGAVYKRSHPGPKDAPAIARRGSRGRTAGDGRPRPARRGMRRDTGRAAERAPNPGGLRPYDPEYRLLAVPGARQVRPCPTPGPAASVRPGGAGMLTLPGPSHRAYKGGGSDANDPGRETGRKSGPARRGAPTSRRAEKGPAPPARDGGCGPRSTAPPLLPTFPGGVPRRPPERSPRHTRGRGAGGATSPEATDAPTAPRFAPSAGSPRPVAHAGDLPSHPFAPIARSAEGSRSRRHGGTGFRPQSDFLFPLPARFPRRDLQDRGDLDDGRHPRKFRRPDAIALNRAVRAGRAGVSSRPARVELPPARRDNAPPTSARRRRPTRPPGRGNLR